MDQDNQHGAVGTVLMVAAAFLGGIGLGMLLAPKSGSETRALLGEQSAKVAKQARQLATETADKAKHIAETTIKNNLPDIPSEAWRNVSRDLARELD